MKCNHPVEKQGTTATKTPRLGIEFMVYCDSCQTIIGKCEWKETAPLVFELIFTLDEQ